MKRVTTKSILTLLNFNKNSIVRYYRQLSTEAVDDPEFLQRVVRGGGSWVYGYGIETHVQSTKERRQKKQVKFDRKTIFSLPFS